MYRKSARWCKWTVLLWRSATRDSITRTWFSAHSAPFVITLQQWSLPPLAPPVALFLSRRARNAFSSRCIYRWRSQAASHAEMSPRIFLTTLIKRIASVSATLSVHRCHRTAWKIHAIPWCSLNPFFFPFEIIFFAMIIKMLISIDITWLFSSEVKTLRLRFKVDNNRVKYSLLAWECTS